MAKTYKTLGQQKPGAAANANAYTVPAVTSAIVSTIIICNTLAAADKVRIFVRIGGAAAGQGNAIAYDANIDPNGIITLTLGVTLATTDIVTVYSLNGGVTFTVSGVELT